MTTVNPADIAAALTAAEQLLTRAETEGRDLSEAEQAEYDGHLERARTLTTQQQQNDQRRAALGAAIRAGRVMLESGDSGRGHAENLRQAGGAPELRRQQDPYEGLEEVRAGMVRGADLVGRVRTAIEQAPPHMSEAARERVTRVIDTYAGSRSRQAPLLAQHMLLTGSPEYHREFEDYARTGYPGPLLRAAMSLTDSAGGYLVPFTLDATVILTNAGVRGSIREVASNAVIATDSWNGVTSAGITAEWTAEASEWADASPEFGQPTITPKKADAWIQGSYEVLADSGFADQLGRLLADAKMRHEEEAFATANVGATRPRGVIAAVAAVTASLVGSTTTGAFVVDDVYEVSSAMQPRWENSAVWMANKTILNRIRQFDTSGGGSFWANLGMGQPEQLLGDSVYRCSSMDSAVTTGAQVLLAGDFSEFKIVDRIGMTVLFEPIVKGANRRPTGESGFAAYWRVGSGVTNVDAFRLLQLRTSPTFTALA